VLEARHGADALRIVEESGRSFDIVVTDLVMPELGGKVDLLFTFHLSRCSRPDTTRRRSAGCSNQ
jgi:CheY-like chemotaxis protein